MRVVVTGASGFVGRALAFHLSAGENCAVVAPLRRPEAPPGIEAVSLPDIGPDTEWRDILVGADAVVHCAGRAHVLHDPESDPLAAFRRVNTAGTLRLAQACAVAGVRRFVYLSSVKVHGERTERGHPYSEDDPLTPTDPYALSKLEAEQGLRHLEQGGRLDVVILRPPLIYGPGAKANMLRLMKLVARGFPLPLALVDNRRSMVGLDNLVSAISAAIARPEAAGRSYLVSDQEDVSTPDLVRMLAGSMGRSARLLPVPASVLQTAAAVLGRREEVERLIGNLQVDSSRISAELGWRPPRTLRDGIGQMVGDFLATAARPG